MTTETLYVASYTQVNRQWTEVGASPWLNDSDANYVYTKTDEYWHEEFVFADSGVGAGTINSVKLYLEIKGSSARNDFVVIDVYDGASWTNVANQDPDVDDYTWFNFDISALLNSWEKINAAKLRVQYQRSGSPSTVEIYIRRAYLYVDYSTGPTQGWNKFQFASEPPSGGAWNQLKYVVEPPVAAAWNKLAYEGE